MTAWFSQIDLVQVGFGGAYVGYLGAVVEGYLGHGDSGFLGSGGATIHSRRPLSGGLPQLRHCLMPKRLRRLSCPQRKPLPKLKPVPQRQYRNGILHRP